MAAIHIKNFLRNNFLTLLAYSWIW